ncbi:MAG: DUF4405 domain-containing protein [Anaerolineae bacterium]
MGKTALKIALNIAMAALLVLMYHKRAVTLSFHELGGIVVCVLFLVHKAVNWQWIRGITARLLGRRVARRPLPGRTLLGYLLNVLLFLSMAAILVTGLLIAETLPTGVAIGRATWRDWHYFASALAILLTGIHIGLHWPYLRGVFSRVVRLPRVVSRPLGILGLAALLVYGTYSAVTSPLSDWLGAPLSSALGIENESCDGTHEEGAVTGELEAEHTEHAEGEGDGLGRGQGGPGRGLGRGSGGGSGLGLGGANQTPSLARTLETLATYGSILAAAAIVTGVLDTALRENRRPRSTAAPAVSAPGA